MIQNATGQDCSAIRASVVSISTTRANASTGRCERRRKERDNHVSAGPFPRPRCQAVGDNHDQVGMGAITVSQARLASDAISSQRITSWGVLHPVRESPLAQVGRTHGISNMGQYSVVRIFIGEETAV